MSFTRPFLLGPVFFRTPLLCSGGYHQVMGGMPLHNAVGITVIRADWDNYWKTRRRCQVYGLRGHNGLYMSTPPGWKEKVVVYYYYC